MATPLADVFVQARVDTSRMGSDLSRGLNSPTVGAAATQAGKTTGSKFTTGISTGVKSFAAGALSGLGIAALVSGFKDVAAEGREAQKATGLTNAVIKSTGGIANVTAADVSSLAEALSEKIGVDDEAIQSGQNMLLTFTNVRNEVGKGNDVFDQATVTIQDMAAAFGGDATSNAKLLGKALNDPVVGLTALTRVGVAFTSQQKEQIAALAESGDLMGAQKLILAELARETGGAAESQATAAEKARVAFANLQEELATQLLPALDAVEEWFATDGVDAIRAFGGILKDDVLPPVKIVAEGIGVLADAFDGLPGPVKETAVVMGLAALAVRRFGIAAAGSAVTGSLRRGMEAIHFQGLLVQESMGKATTATGKFGAAAGVAARGGAQALSRGVGGLVGILGGPWGLALGGAATALTILGKESAATASAQADLNSITTTLVDTLDRQTQAATKSTYAAITSELSDVTEQANRAGLALETIAGASTGNTSDFAAMADALGLSTDELRSMAGLASSLNSRDQFGVFSDLTDDQTDLVYALGQTGQGFLNAQEAARLSTDAVAKVGGAFQGARPPVEGLGDDVEKTTEEMRGFNSVAATIISRQLGLAQAIMDAKAAMGEQEKGFRKNTDAGQENWKQVLALASATDGYKASTESGRAAIEKARGAIIDFADAQGMTAEEARKLAARLLGVKGASEDVSNTPAKARVSETGADETLGKIGQVAAGLANLDGRTARVNIAAVVSYVQGAFDAVNPFNADGALYMAGGGLRKALMGDGKRPIVWNEAGPEAYIPLSNDGRRPRALDIWRQTGRELGAMADGGVLDGFGIGRRDDAGAVHDDFAALIRAVRESFGKGSPLVGKLADIGADAVDAARERDKILALVSDRNSLVSSTRGAFTADAFGSGARTAQGLVAFARDAVARTRRFLRAERTLISRGMDPALIRSLVGTGPDAVDAAVALADAPAGLFRQFESLTRTQRRLAGDIGTSAGRGIYGDLDRDLDRITRRLERFAAEAVDAVRDGRERRDRDGGGRHKLAEHLHLHGADENRLVREIDIRDRQAAAIAGG